MANAYATDNGSGVFTIGNDFIERQYTFAASKYLCNEFKNKISGTQYIYQANLYDNYRIDFGPMASLGTLTTLLGSGASHDSATTIITNITGGVQLQVTIPISTYGFTEIWTYTCLNTESVITTQLTIRPTTIVANRIKLVHFDRQNIAFLDSVNAKLRVYQGTVENIKNSGSGGVESEGFQLFHDITNGEGIFTMSYEVEGQSFISTNQAGNFRQWQILMDNLAIPLSVSTDVILHPHISGVYQGDYNYAYYQCITYGNNHQLTSPENYPVPGYFSWYDINNNQSDAAVTARLSLLQSLGINGVFFIDDTWQTTVTNPTSKGGYGDWVVFSNPSTGFPNLAQTAINIKNAGLIPGIWFCIEASQTSQAASTYIGSVTVNSDTSLKTVGNDYVMCLGSFEWIDYLIAKMGPIFKLGYTYTRIDFLDAFFYPCYATNHSHQSAGADASVANDWRRSHGEGLRRLIAGLKTYQPNLIVQYQQQCKALIDIFDNDWTNDWNNDPISGGHNEDFFNTATKNRYTQWQVNSKTFPGHTHQGWCETHNTNGYASQGTSGFEYFVLSSLGICVSTGITGQTLLMNTQEQAFVKKWLAWNKINKKYLKYSRLISTNTPDYTGMINVDIWAAIANDGGWIWAFNPSTSDQVITVNNLYPRKYASNLPNSFRIIDENNMVVWSGNVTSSQDISIPLFVPAKGYRYLKIDNLNHRIQL